MQEVITRSGRIDVLINNAGFSYIGLTEACTLADFQHQFDTNFFGVVRVNRAVLPHMRRQGRGLLIYMSSAGGRVSSPFWAIPTPASSPWRRSPRSSGSQLYRLGIDTVILQPGRHATSVASNFRSPSDPDRSASYGPVATQIDQAVADFRASFAPGEAPSPQAVLDAVEAVPRHTTGNPPVQDPHRHTGAGAD